jgi:arginase
MTTPGDLSLLVPEWQGCGHDASVGAGARALAAQFPDHAFAVVEAPEIETLATDEGVIGLSSIAQRTRETLAVIDARHPSRIFMLAGTCAAELAPVTYLADRYRGDLAVVWLDAHGDLNTPQSSPSGRFHGMVLRTLIGDGPAALVALIRRPLVPTEIVLAGVRDLDRDEARFISDKAISRFSPGDLLVPDRVSGRLRSIGFTKVYIHLDLDVLDPIEFPDVLVPAPGGVSTGVLTETVRALASTFDVVGFSVVELRPVSQDAATRVRRLVDGFGLSIGVLA